MMAGSDTFASAADLVLGVDDPTPVASLTTESGEPLLSANDAAPYQGERSAWWQFTPAAAGLLSVDSLQSTGTVNDWDINISVFTGTTLADLVPIGTDDYRSRWTVTRVAVEAGQTVYVQAMVWPGSSSSIAYVLNASFQQFGPPINLVLGGAVGTPPSSLSDGYVWPQIVFGAAPQLSDGGDTSYVRAHGRDVPSTYGATADIYAPTDALPALAPGAQILAIGWTVRLMVPSSSFYGSPTSPLFPSIYLRNSAASRLLHMANQPHSNDHRDWSVTTNDDLIRDYHGFVPPWTYTDWSTNAQAVYTALTTAGQVEVFPGRSTGTLPSLQEGDMYVYEVSVSFYPLAILPEGGPLAAARNFLA